MNENAAKTYKVLLEAGCQPRTSKAIGQATGLTDIQIRVAVRELREVHRLKICSGREGFWIWNGSDDSWSHTKNQIRSRYNSLRRLYTAMEFSPDPDQVRLEIGDRE